MKKINVLTKAQKQERALITILSIVALVLLVFSVKAFTKDSTVPVADTTVPTVSQTVAANVTTTVPTSVTTKPAETEPATTKPAEQTTAPAVIDETEEILKMVSDGVNSLKSSDANFTGHKVQNISMELVDSSVPSMNGLVNSIIKAFVKEEIYDYDFTNGVSYDPESGGTIDSDDAFPPGDIPFTLTKEGVAKATKTAEGANTVYTVVIVAETSTLENPRPPHHNSGADTLDLSTVEIPIATITKADFEYPGATVSVTVDSEGNVVGYYEHLAISGTGEVEGLGMSGYGTIEGYIDEKWDISWK